MCSLIQCQVNKCCWKEEWNVTKRLYWNRVKHWRTNQFEWSTSFAHRLCAASLLHYFVQCIYAHVSHLLSSALLLLLHYRPCSLIHSPPLHPIPLLVSFCSSHPAASLALSITVSEANANVSGFHRNCYRPSNVCNIRTGIRANVVTF